MVGHERTESRPCVERSPRAAPEALLVDRGVIVVFELPATKVTLQGARIRPQTVGNTARVLVRYAFDRDRRPECSRQLFRAAQGTDFGLRIELRPAVGTLPRAGFVATWIDEHGNSLASLLWRTQRKTGT